MDQLMASQIRELPGRNDKTPCRAGGFLGADDGIRTRDPHLGKVMLYQLSHIRVRLVG